MIHLIYTSFQNLHIAFIKEEIEKIVELNREIIARKPLENIRVHHVAYKEKWYPLFDLQKIFCISPSSPVRYAIMIKDTTNSTMCGICTPNPVEEISVSQESIYPFPAFLLQKQELCLIYALVQTSHLSLFLCSLTDIWHPITLAQYLLHKVPQPLNTGGKNDTNR